MIFKKFLQWYMQTGYEDQFCLKKWKQRGNISKCNLCDQFSCTFSLSSKYSKMSIWYFYNLKTCDLKKGEKLCQHLSCVGKAEMTRYSPVLKEQKNPGGDDHDVSVWWWDGDKGSLPRWVALKQLWRIWAFVSASAGLSSALLWLCPPLASHLGHSAPAIGWQCFRVCYLCDLCMLNWANIGYSPTRLL